MEPVVLNEQNFNDTIAEGIVVVDFWAEWCGPCQQMLPILSEFASEMGDKVTVGKVNVDEAQPIAQNYRVMSIPTLMIFKDGEPVEQFVGVQTIETLREACEKHM